MASDDSVVVTAPSVDEAVIVGLTRLMATRDEVEIEVMDEGTRGFLGLGMREARVRVSRGHGSVPAGQVTPVAASEPMLEPEIVVVAPEQPEPGDVTKSAQAAAAPKDVAAPAEAVPDQKVSERTAVPSDVKPKPTKTSPRPPARGGASPADGLDRDRVTEIAKDIVAHVLPEMAIEATIEWIDEDRPTIWISLSGRDADALVGPRARNLHSIQYLFRALLYHQYDGDYNVVVDADGYRKRRRRSLETMAQTKADQAVEQGKTVQLRAMPAHERRIVHIILREDDRVSTESVGKGRDRAVTIVPRSASERGNG